MKTCFFLNLFRQQKNNVEKSWFILRLCKNRCYSFPKKTLAPLYEFILFFFSVCIFSRTWKKNHELPQRNKRLDKFCKKDPNLLSSPIFPTQTTNDDQHSFGIQNLKLV